MPLVSEHSDRDVYRNVLRQPTESQAAASNAISVCAGTFCDTTSHLAQADDPRWACGNDPAGIDVSELQPSHVLMLANRSPSHVSGRPVRRAFRSSTTGRPGAIIDVGSIDCGARLGCPDPNIESMKRPAGARLHRALAYIGVRVFRPLRSLISKVPFATGLYDLAVSRVVGAHQLARCARARITVQ